MSGKRQIEKNGDLKIGELPELHIVGLDDIVLHEDPDMERVARLVDRFSADGILKNPPVVGRSKGHRRIVLDGANRVTALRKLGYPTSWFRSWTSSTPGWRWGPGTTPLSAWVQKSSWNMRRRSRV